MLKIRLQRIGKKKQAYFRVVVTEHTLKPKGKYLEDLGAYDPHKNEISVDVERIKYWLNHGAQASPTVNNLLVGRGLIEGKKARVWKHKPQKQNEETQKNQKTQTQTENETTETKALEQNPVLDSAQKEAI